MKRLLLAAALASLTLTSHAGSSDQWFGHGVSWYEHPCGMQAFAKYGHDSSPQVIRAYAITLRDPAQCSTLFP